MLLNRRKLIKAGIKGLAALVVGRSLTVPEGFVSVAYGHTATTFHIAPREVMLEMIDLKQVFHWAWDFENPPAEPPPPGGDSHGHVPATIAGPRIPGPVIFCHEGDSLTFTVSNPLNEAHGFEVVGVAASNTGPIPPGGAETVTFNAPAAGTYIYHDPVNFPVNRVLGLHGMLVVLPVAGNTPYTTPTPAVQKLFDDLGTAPHFPGEPWDPVRTHIWIFSSIDPRYNRRAMLHQPISPADFQENFQARYFPLSGRQGYFCAHDPNIALIGRAGEPRIIRNVNVGMCVNSPHVHANHSYLLSINHQIMENVAWIDTWRCKPGDVYDVLYPMIKPPDIPADTWQRLKNGTSQERFPGNPMHPAQGGFPMFYPMHCHLEMSQTADGGNYPQGLVTHIEFTGAHPNA